MWEELVESRRKDRGISCLSVYPSYQCIFNLFGVVVLFMSDINTSKIILKSLNYYYVYSSLSLSFFSLLVFNSDIVIRNVTG